MISCYRYDGGNCCSCSMFCFWILIHINACNSMPSILTAKFYTAFWFFAIISPPCVDSYLVVPLYCSKHSASKWTTLKTLALWRFIEENKEADLGTRGHKKLHLWGFKVIRSPRPSAPDLEPSSHYSTGLSRPHQRPLVGTKGAFPGGF